MDIIDVYKSILHCGGMQADPEGFINLQFAKENPRPVVISTKEGDKRLVLPTDDQLRHGDMTKRIVFHPLIESLHRGESEVGEKLRESIGMNLNMSLCYVAIALLTLSTSPAEHAKLSPDQTIFMSAVKEADEGTIERLIKISEQMALGDAQKSFVHIFVKRGATIKGKKYHRAGIVSFPFYEELKKIPEPKMPNEVFGVKLRKIDRECLTNLLEYMIPGIDSPQNFCSTSNSDVAPTLDALLSAMANIAIHINAMVALFGKHLPEGDQIRFDLDWQYAFQNLESLKPQIRMIPQQAGNEGKQAKEMVPQNKIISLDPHMHTPPPPEPRPLQTFLSNALAPNTPLDQQSTTTKKLDHFGRPYEERQRQAVALPTVTPPPVYQSPYPPPPPNPYPQYPQAQAPGYPPAPIYNAPQPNPSAIVRTPYGTDFRSLLAARPDLAAAAGAPPRPGFTHPQNNMETPRWAISGYTNPGGFGSV